MLSHPAFEFDWNLVRTFVAVADEGSLAGGARTLGITHPTAARHIQLLEESLGFHLFSRTTRGLKLNDVGHELALAARDMYQSALRFQASTDRVRETPVENVRIGVSEILAELLPQVVLEAVRARQAAHATTVELLVSNELLNLLNRDADFAVRHVRPHQQELLCKRVGIIQMGAYASEQYARQFPAETLGDFSQHLFIEGLSRDYVTRGAAKQGIDIDPAQISFRTDSAASQRAALNAGWGVAVLPYWMSKESRWVSIFPEDHVIDMEVWLVARPEVRDNQDLRAVFMDLGATLENTLSTLACKPGVSR